MVVEKETARRPGLSFAIEPRHVLRLQPQQPIPHQRPIPWRKDCWFRQSMEAVLKAARCLLSLGVFCKFTPSI